MWYLFINLVMCSLFVTSYAAENPKVFNILINQDHFIHVPYGALDFTIYDQKFNSSIGPIEKIYLTDDQKHIEWQRGKMFENIEVPEAPLGWKKYLATLPGKACRALVSYVSRTKIDKK